jgi:hypothetical protein
MQDFEHDDKMTLSHNRQSAFRSAATPANIPPKRLDDHGAHRSAGVAQ